MVICRRCSQARHDRPRLLAIMNGARVTTPASRPPRCHHSRSFSDSNDRRRGDNRARPQPKSPDTEARPPASSPTARHGLRDLLMSSSEMHSSRGPRPAWPGGGQALACHAGKARNRIRPVLLAGSSGRAPGATGCALAAVLRRAGPVTGPGRGTTRTSSPRRRPPPASAGRSSGCQPSQRRRRS